MRVPDPLDAFRTVPAYVLLGDPGSGKSTSFEAERDALGDDACLVTARDFLALEPDAHPEWRGKTLFIDGFDEVRAGGGDARTPLDVPTRPPRCAWKAALPPVVPREADWLGANDRVHLARVSADARVTVLRLDPLDDDSAVRILRGPSASRRSRGIRLCRQGQGSRGVSQESPEPPDAGRHRERRRRAGRRAVRSSSRMPAGAWSANRTRTTSSEDRSCRRRRAKRNS